MSKLKCSIVEDLMPLYIEDLLNEETKKDIELHLDECEDCKEVYDELKKGVNLEYEKNMDLKEDEYEELKTDTLNSIKNYLNKIKYILHLVIIIHYSRMPQHSCCEVRVMQSMTYFFCAPLQSCRRLYQ